MQSPSTSTTPAWIAFHRAHLNPERLEPTDDASAAIASAFSSTLFSRVLDDIKAGKRGQRLHLWADRHCMLAFELRLTPSNTGLVSALTSSRAAQRGAAALDGIVCDATWIFCPQMSVAPVTVCRMLFSRF